MGIIARRVLFFKISKNLDRIFNLQFTNFQTILKIKKLIHCFEIKNYKHDFNNYYFRIYVLELNKKHCL